jgi:hypothetical protein
MSTSLRITLWVFGISCVLVLSYFIYAHFSASSLPQPISSSPAPTNEVVPAPGFTSGGATSTEVAANDTPRTPPAGTLEYRNPTYRFSLFYPDTLSVKEFDEGGGASTITFQNVSTVQGFQIFVVPYGAPQVSTARFKEDEPSGVMQQPLDVTIGGVSATSFYSTDANLGDTAEIWFIQGGYLFEVTAPKSLAPWFSQIMQAWEFI